ncbi:MAG: SRPBCC family protein [Bacteroidota bacterium]
MPGTFSATVKITIHKDTTAVWNALTDPNIIKQYFFGTQTETDWKKGSPIVFRGEWEGKKYEDKGIILDIQPEKRVQYSYWSSMSGTPDRPENYSVITYELTNDGTSTMLTITQDGINTVEQKNHSEKNWKYVMEGMKKLVEGI